MASAWDAGIMLTAGRHTAGLCFGAGLGITLFGISYMFIHDGLVHRRFPVGPIAEVQRSALRPHLPIAHKMWCLRVCSSVPCPSPPKSASVSSMT